MRSFHFRLSDRVKDRLSGLRFGVLTAEGVTVRASGAHFERELQNLDAFLCTKFQKRKPAQDEIIGHIRRMYRLIGWEPTRYRPSSEALVRRILQGKGLYRINNLVDYGNLISARFHIPMGLYDTSKIKGDILVDTGSENEMYQGISRPEIHARGKMILRDDAGIFGNPTADSLRTAITPETKVVLAVFFGTTAIGKEYFRETLSALKDYYGYLNPKARFSTDIIEPK